jgi:hypothetical protein
MVEKSTGANYNVWMNMFNSFVNDTALMEIYRGGGIDLLGQISKEPML